MEKYVIIGSRATIIVSANSSLDAGARAAVFNLGVIKDIRLDTHGKATKPKTGRANQTPGGKDSRHGTSRVPKVQFVFPIGLCAERTSE